LAGKGEGWPLLSDVYRYITPKHIYEELGEGVIKAPSSSSHL